MYNIIKTKEKYIKNLYEYIADSENDIKNLPTDKTVVNPGSTCICINESSVWILNNCYEWCKL